MKWTYEKKIIISGIRCSDIYVSILTELSNGEVARAIGKKMKISGGYGLLLFGNWQHLAWI